MNEKVKAYLEKLPSPQKEICYLLREIILDHSPQLEESFKNGVPWYEDKYYIVGLKDHVNLGFSIKGLSKDELKLLDGSGKLMRHIKIHTVDEVDEAEVIKLMDMVKAAI